MFAQVDENSQEELLLLFRPKDASPGERVIRSGDRGDGMYFISSGAVEVQLEDDPVRLEAGSFFGEMALLSGGRRTADVIAVDFCQFLVLERRDFNVFMSKHPALRAAVSDMAKERKAMNVSRRKRNQRNQSLDAT
jgi:CPA2 family monovalent cation:H+ antiporter-2